MTSKERVLAAFRREKSDRVPLDYGANAAIHQKLMRHVGAKTNDGLLDALGVDFRELGAPYAGPPLFAGRPGRKVDPVYGYYMRWAENADGGYWDFCDFPLQNADEETIANYPLPAPDDFDYSDAADFAARYGQFAVYAGHPGYADIINSLGRVMNMEDALVNLHTQNEATMHYVRRMADMQLGVLERMLRAAGGKVDFLFIGEDLGTQIAPMISLKMYRKVLRPLHQRYIDLAGAYHIPVMVHTCGASSWVYEDFIEMGVAAVDTLQPEAAGMDPATLRERFGGRLSFHGCISTAGALATGSEDDVRKTVRETLDILMPTHGYMCAPTHMIQDNTPPENVLAMYDEARRHGVYAV